MVRNLVYRYHTYQPCGINDQNYTLLDSLLEQRVYQWGLVLTSRGRSSSLNCARAEAVIDGDGGLWRGRNSRGRDSRGRDSRASGVLKCWNVNTVARDGVPESHEQDGWSVVLIQHTHTHTRTHTHARAHLAESAYIVIGAMLTQWTHTHTHACTHAHSAESALGHCHWGSAYRWHRPPTRHRCT